MTSIHNIIHQVANDVVGRHLGAERLEVEHNSRHVSSYDVQDIRGIIRVEYLRSHSLLTSPANNAFAYSYNICGVNTFPGIQIINDNNVRIDQVHGLGDITHQAGGGSSYNSLIARWQGGNRDHIYTTVVNTLNINHSDDVDLAILTPNDARYVQEMLSLFCIELGRSPSSLITTAMFYELYSQGYDTLSITTPLSSTQDVPDVFYPMARKDSVSQFRKIYDVTFSGFAFNIRYVYDQGYPQSGALDAKRMLLAEARCAAVWYNLYGKNGISADDLQFDQSLLDAQARVLPSNFTGIRTQDDHQENDFRQAISNLGTRIYGLPLEGIGEDGVNIGWIHAHFGKYTMASLVQILSLRMDSLQLYNIEILPGVFVDSVMNNISELISNIISSAAEIILVPFDLFNKHAVGLVFEKSADEHAIKVKYFDPKNVGIPLELKQLMNKIPSLQVSFEEMTVELQRYTNCGPEVIENFVFYLTGHRVAQERAVELHSSLVESQLVCPKELNLLSNSDDHLLDSQNFVLGLSGTYSDSYE